MQYLCVLKTEISVLNDTLLWRLSLKSLAPFGGRRAYVRKTPSQDPTHRFRIPDILPWPFPTQETRYDIVTHKQS